MEKSGLIERKTLKETKERSIYFLQLKALKVEEWLKTFLLEFNEKISSKVKERDIKGFFNVMNALDLSIEEVDKEKNTKS